MASPNLNELMDQREDNKVSEIYITLALADDILYWVFIPSP